MHTPIGAVAAKYWNVTLFDMTLLPNELCERTKNEYHTAEPRSLFVTVYRVSVTFSYSTK